MVRLRLTTIAGYSVLDHPQLLLVKLARHEPGHILAEMLLRMEVPLAGIESGDPDEIVTNALRGSDTKRILEIGCGDCRFLLAISTVVEQAGCTLQGIDVEPYPSDETRQALDSTRVDVLRGDANDLQESPCYDFVISASVLSYFGIHRDGISDQSKCSSPLIDINELWELRDRCQALARKGVRLLNGRASSAYIIASYTSVLMLFQEQVQAFARIAAWETRRETWTACHLLLENAAGLLPERFLRQLWKQSATFAVLERPGTT